MFFTYFTFVLYKYIYYVMMMFSIMLSETSGIQNQNFVSLVIFFKWLKKTVYLKSYLFSTLEHNLLYKYTVTIIKTFNICILLFKSEKKEISVGYSELSLL